MKIFYTCYRFRKPITDHNRPQLNLKTSGSPLNNNNRLIIEAGSLCNSDSVDEENEIEEQSGQFVKFHCHSEGERKQYLSRII